MGAVLGVEWLEWRRSWLEAVRKGCETIADLDIPEWAPCKLFLHFCVCKFIAAKNGAH